MNDLFEIIKTYQYLYIGLKRRLTEKDFKVVSEKENSVQFISDNPWEVWEDDDRIRGTLRIQLANAEEIENELTKIYPEWSYDYTSLKYIFRTYSIKINRAIKYTGCRGTESKTKKRQKIISQAKHEMKVRQQELLDSLIKGTIKKIALAVNCVKSQYIDSVANYLHRNQSHTVQNKLTPETKNRVEKLEDLSLELKKLKYKITQERDIVHQEEKVILIKMLQDATDGFPEAVKSNLITVLEKKKRDSNGLLL